MNLPVINLTNSINKQMIHLKFLIITKIHENQNSVDQINYINGTTI